MSNKTRNPKNKFNSTNIGRLISYATSNNEWSLFSKIKVPRLAVKIRNSHILEALKWKKENLIDKYYPSSAFSYFFPLYLMNERLVIKTIFFTYNLTVAFLKNKIKVLSFYYAAFLCDLDITLVHYNKKR